MNMHKVSISVELRGHTSFFTPSLTRFPLNNSILFVKVTEEDPGAVAAATWFNVIVDKLK